MPVTAPPNVLLADDEPANLTALAAALDDMGLNLVQVRSGREALRCVLDHDFAVILLDVRMPDMDGYETARLIRQRERSQNTPIIFLTAYASSDEQVFRGYEVGAVDFTFKPFMREIVRSKVAVFVQLHRNARELKLANDSLQNAEQDVRRLNQELEQRVIERTRELETTNEKLTREIAERQRSEAQLREKAVQLEAAKLSLEDTTNALAASVSSLAKTNEDLGHRIAELDEFTYVASHDLQEPLRVLISFGDLLRRHAGDNLPEQAAKDLDRIVDAARRMQTLVEDLISLSRAGRSAMRPEPVSLDACVDAALQALASRIEETGAQIARDELPTVLGDHSLLTELYQNLIGNALKFVAAVPPAVHLTAEREGATWLLGVRDNGIGIKPEYGEQVFAPFKRLHGRGEYEGTGIGLAICRKVVERHGGRIWVESEPGNGAHFRFTLNAVEEPSGCESGTEEHASFC